MPINDPFAFMVPLAFKVLERALRDIVSDPLPGKAEKCSRRHTARECAVSWVSNEVENPVLSFDDCCDAMNWDPSWASKKMLEAKSTDVWEALGLRRGIVDDLGAVGAMLNKTETREAFYKAYPEQRRRFVDLVPHKNWVHKLKDKRYGRAHRLNMEREAGQ